LSQNGIPADNNAYVYSGTERSTSFIFENGLQKTFKMEVMAVPMGYELMKANHRMLMLLIFAFNLIYLQLIE
jgi:hypothetical protein